LDHGARLNIGTRTLCQCRKTGKPHLQAWRGELQSPTWYPLHMAICYGRVSIFKILERRGACLDDVCAGASAGKKPTALHQAAYIGNRDIVDYILERPGAKKRVSATVYARTALDLVYAGSGSIKHNREARAHIIKRLVEFGARLEHDPNTDSSVLFRACRCGAFGIAVDLIRLGACPAISPPALHTMLYYAIYAHHSFHCARSGRYDPHDDFYAQNPDVRQRERLELVRLLVKMGADPNAQWAGEEPRLRTPCVTQSPLMLAICPGSFGHRAALEMVKLLVELGSNPQATNANGMTLLHALVNTVMISDELVPRATYDVTYSIGPILEYLLQRGLVAIDTRDRQGKTVLDYVYDQIGQNIAHWATVGPEHPLYHAYRGAVTELQEWRLLRVQLAKTLLQRNRRPVPQTILNAELARLKYAHQLCAGQGTEAVLELMGPPQYQPGEEDKSDKGEQT